MVLLELPLTTELARAKGVKDMNLFKTQSLSWWENILPGTQQSACIIIHKTGVVLSDLPLLTLSADSAVRCSRASSVCVTDCNAAAW